MQTKTILITGATDGIGKQTALILAQMGHEIIVHGKNTERGKQTVDWIIEKSRNSNIHYINANLSNFKQINILADTLKTKFSKLDVLLNNAGVFMNERVILPNGLETTFMVNHMAVFSLTKSLLPLLKETTNSRIINVSSMAQSGTMDFDNLNGEKYWDPYNAYAVSKLENVLFTYKLNSMLTKQWPTVNCLHPGIINTKLLHAGWGIGGASLATGAETSVFLSVNEDISKISGKYFVNSIECKSSAISYDKKIQNRLWEISEDIIENY